jgi:pimeloyl-ACP methyl ester carboxylesterase/DNA-binding SARP family transcriptional activator
MKSNIDNTTIHYEYIKCNNNELADTVLLVHGIGLDLTIWDPVVPMLQDNYHVLRCDLPGHGANIDEPESVTWELLIKSIVELLTKLGIPKVHYIGHSGGGNLGIELAKHRGQIIKSLTFIATPIFIPKELGKEEQVNRGLRSKTGKIEDIVSPIVQILCYPPTPNKLDKLINIYKKVSVATYLQYFELYFEKVFSYSLEEIQQLKVPMMMLVGEHDILYPPQLQMLNISYLNDMKFYIIPGASNVIMMDHPEGFIQFLNLFIDNTKVTMVETGFNYFYSKALNKEINVIVDSGIQYSDTNKVIKVEMIKSFKIIIDGNEVIGKWNQRKAKQLMAYLAFHKSATREQLVDIFWPEHDLNKARNQLRVSLNHIKAIIEEHTQKDISEYISFGRELIELIAEVKIDVNDLVEILHDIEQKEDVYLKLSLIMEHLNMIPEVLFSSFYEDWVLEIRSTIENRIIDICEDILDRNIKDEYAIEILKLLIRFNPSEILYYNQLIPLLQKENRVKELQYYEQKREIQLEN